MSIPGVAPTSRVLVALALALGACRDPGSDAAKPPATPSAQPAAASPSAAATAVAATPTPAATAVATAASAPTVAAEPAPTGLRPLSDAAREQFLAGEADAPIPVEIHYVQSNETRHDLFAPYITDLGGAYVGVGSDQNFTMMAMARSEIAFLLDIDRRVVELQQLYQVLVPRFATPRELVDAWHARNQDSTRAILEEAFADRDEKERARLLRGFATARETVYRHLERVIARNRDGAPSTWLSDPEHYAHVRAMFSTGRVRMMPGDLTGAHSLQTVGAACKAMGIAVKVLYFSNAEEYFKYTPQFVANLEALPIDDASSKLLRTIYNKKWVHADLWAYQVQPIADFRARLADRKNRSRNPMLRYADIDGKLVRDTGKEGLTLVALSPA